MRSLGLALRLTTVQCCTSFSWWSRLSFRKSPEFFCVFYGSFILCSCSMFFSWRAVGQNLRKPCQQHRQSSSDIVANDAPWSLQAEAAEVGMVQLPLHWCSHPLARTSILVAHFQPNELNELAEISKIALLQAVFLLFSYKFELANQPFDV